MKKRILVMLLALAMAFSMVACGNNDSNSNDSNANNTNSGTSSTDGPGSGSTGGEVTELEEGRAIIPGTVMNFRLPNDNDTMLPWTSARSAGCLIQVYDTLMMPYMGDWNDIRGMLAREWTVSDDEMTYVFQITDEAYFSNGNHLTAQSIVDCWDYTIQYQPSYFANVVSYEATGEYELTVKLDAPNPYLLANFATIHTGICDASVVDELGPTNDEAAIGTGAYVITNITPGSVTSMKANENYWFKEEMPVIETLNYWVITDTNAAISSFEAGEIDVLDTNDPVIFETVSQFPNAKYISTYDHTRVLWFDPANEPAFEDINVRKGLLYCVNLEEVNLAMASGLGTNDYMLWRNTFGVKGSDEYSYDPDKGLAMIREAGYEPSDISFSITGNVNGQNMAGCENIQAQLAALGFNVTVTTYEVNTGEQMLFDGSLEMGCAKCDMLSTNPKAGLGTYFNSAATKPAVRITSLYPEMDAIYEKAVASTNHEEIMGYCQEMHDLLMDNAAGIPMAGECRWYIYNSKLSNVIADNQTLRVYWRWANIEA